MAQPRFPVVLLFLVLQEFVAQLKEPSFKQLGSSLKLLMVRTAWQVDCNALSARLLPADVAGNAAC